MIRVVNLKMNERILIKGMSSEILDLQFAHLSTEILLACIEQTALHIYKIESSTISISHSLLLIINIESVPENTTEFAKVNWCPYVPEKVDEIDDVSSKLLVWVRGNQFEYYSISTILANYGSGTHKAQSIKEGCIKNSKTAHVITGATFSPDGTTLAISFDDGYIRFYQVYMHGGDSNPRCLHEWNPHDGKPISCLFFLDNHVNYNTT